MYKTAIIIPARFNSSRFPGKSLELIDEYNVIQTVYQRALKVKSADKVIVATDDERILNSISDIGGEAVMTRADHENGTCRIAEVARDLDDFHYILNLQGDEPFVEPSDVDLLIEHLERDNDIHIVSLMKECSELELEDPHSVKVIVDDSCTAKQFSRNTFELIPHGGQVYYKHIGIYGFQRKTLLELLELKPTNSERKERLEQLRWLDHGYPIHMIKTNTESIGIDVPADLVKAKAFSQSLL